MDSKVPSTTNTSDTEFNTILFEKRLTGLKDSQESINNCCHWCLQNRQHHKKIVSCWLNVLKRVKVEQRLTLFYLANDVIQYSKRRNYDFVESWGTTLQKATTMVRDEKVKNKVLRIFKIWEQRNIYGDEFITDLCGLISASPTSRKGDETHEFQPAYLIQKIRTCSKLEADTDVKLRQLKEHNPKIQIESDSLISSLKDRAHVDDVEKELEDYTKQMENYINALKLEIKSRIHLISLLSQAETQLENDKKDVKLVTTAYRTFAARVKALKKKLDEKLPTLVSPIPSPDINAPSPSPDSDIELPGTITTDTSVITVSTSKSNSTVSDLPSTALYTNAGYYNPVPAPTIDTNSNFNNSFTSFIGTDMSFNLQNINTSSLFNSNETSNTSIDTTGQLQPANSYGVNNAISSLFPLISCPPPPPALDVPKPPAITDYQYDNSSHVPLLPPPMPPFSKADDGYGTQSYGDTYNGNLSTDYANSNYNSTTATDATATTSPPFQLNPLSTDYQNPTPVLEQTSPMTFDSFNTSYPPLPYQNPEPPIVNYPSESVPLANPYPPMEEYNPEEELETWEPEPTWEQPPIELDTPESPPLYEKKGYEDPIEYHDGNSFENIEDVDQRVLPSLITLDEKLGRVKDVDHRNLISLTGSPNETHPNWSSEEDKDYRKPVNQQTKTIDQDYRVPFDIENFKLPPPPPPPNALADQNTDSDEFDSKISLHSNPFNPNINVDSFNPNSFIKNTKAQEQIENTQVLTNKNKFNNPPKRHGLSPRNIQDNIENIDMDLSDEEHHINLTENDMDNQELPDTESLCNNSLELPPPPFPDLFDDVDANNFLDDVNEDLENLASFDPSEIDDVESLSNTKPPILGNVPPPSFQTNFKNSPNLIFNGPAMPPPPLNPGPLWIEQNSNNFQTPPYQMPYFNNILQMPNQNLFRGRGGTFNNRTMRGNWVNRGNIEFRGTLRRPQRGTPIRGNRIMSTNRGIRGARFQGNIRNRGNMRGRGDFRGRGNFRGGF